MKTNLRTFAALVLAGALVAGMAAVVTAGSEGKMAGHDMNTMMAEMQKCTVCKNMMAGMAEWGPAMKAEVVHLDSGMAMIHNITDPAKLASFQTASAATAKAGAGCMSMTDEQVKTQLCAHCQEMVGLAKAGAQISHGMTKTGDMLVITAKDPETIKRINAFEGKCAAMMAAM